MREIPCRKCHAAMPIELENRALFGRRYLFGVCDSCAGAEKTRVLLECLTEAGVPERFSAKLQALVPIPFPADVEWLIITGPAGTGKSHDASCTALAEILAGEEPLFVRWPVFLETRKRSMDSDKTEDPMVRVQTWPGLVIVDDLGAEGAGRSPSPYAIESANLLLGSRYDRRRRTLITTNLLGPQLELVYGERLASRMCEVAKWEPKTGHDRRRSAA